MANPHLIIHLQNATHERNYWSQIVPLIVTQSSIELSKLNFEYHPK
jgi:hypothetical protein